MYRYILKRLILLLPIILGVSLLVFVLLDLAPGNALTVIREDVSAEEFAQMEHELGYDRTVFYRYAVYMKNLVRGDLGKSVSYNANVWDLYMKRIPVTLTLAVLSVIVGVMLSIPLGIISALKRGSLVDNGSMVVALLGLSMPNFWLGLMLMVVFSLELKWFPSGGIKKGFISYILPAFTVGTGMMASLTRTTRSSMLDVINSDYLRTARAKGIKERTVILLHALRNALIPIITSIGVQIGVVVGGAVITENVFSLPGVGRLIIDAVKERDTTLVAGCVIMTAILLSVIQLIIDIIYAFVDPRLKAQYSGSKNKKKTAEGGEKA